MQEAGFILGTCTIFVGSVSAKWTVVLKSGRKCLGLPLFLTTSYKGFPGGSAGKESICNAGDLGSILGWEDPLEKGMATHSSVIAWEIPWTEETGGLQSLGLQESDVT